MASSSIPNVPGTFEPSPSRYSSNDDIPQTLQRAALRLGFPPSYVVVGVYRLCIDPKIRNPAWDKCKHGIMRGAAVGIVWAVLTFKIQRKFIEVFLINSPRVTGLSSESIFGYQIPFSLPTYATVLTLGDQLTVILRFFLSRNIRIAHERAWDQTVKSRGKGPDFWQPYVEEWDNPPVVAKRRGLGAWASGWVWRLIIKRVLFYPLNLYPFVGIFISAGLKSLGTATYLHKPYFEVKKMNHVQQSTFIEERKWDYRIFGFTAALLEGIPIVGLFFTISNRIGAAMWAHDLEKRQHYVAEQRKTTVEVE